MCDIEDVVRKITPVVPFLSKIVVICGFKCSRDE